MAEYLISNQKVESSNLFIRTMGAYSTVTLTRQQAIDKINSLDVESLTNEELENILFAMYGDREVHNYGIINEGENDE